VRLETDRLILRSWEERDRVPLAGVLGDPEVRRFYPKALSFEEASAQFDGVLARQAQHGFHFGAAELKSDGSFVGMIGIGYPADVMRDAIAGRPEVEIGWQFDKAYWGQGLAPEAARAWLAFGFDTVGLGEIVAFTYEGNLPSRRVMEKIGMTRDLAGDFQHPVLPPGHRLRPHVLYRIGKPLT
jgi:RimJ/RimL family protein N-acetyltransferase